MPQPKAVIRFKSYLFPALTPAKPSLESSGLKACGSARARIPSGRDTAATVAQLKHKSLFYQPCNFFRASGKKSMLAPQAIPDQCVGTAQTKSRRASPAPMSFRPARPCSDPFLTSDKAKFLESVSSSSRYFPCLYGPKFSRVHSFHIYHHFPASQQKKHFSWPLLQIISIFSIAAIYYF